MSRTKCYLIIIAKRLVNASRDQSWPYFTINYFMLRIFFDNTGSDENKAMYQRTTFDVTLHLLLELKQHQISQKRNILVAVSNFFF